MVFPHTFDERIAELCSGFSFYKGPWGTLTSHVCWMIIWLPGWVWCAVGATDHRGRDQYHPVALSTFTAQCLWPMTVPSVSVSVGLQCVEQTWLCKCLCDVTFGNLLALQICLFTELSKTVMNQSRDWLVRGEGYGWLRYPFQTDYLNKQ